MYVCMYVSLSLYTYMRIYINTYVCTYIYIYLHIYIYIYIYILTRITVAGGLAPRRRRRVMEQLVGRHRKVTLTNISMYIYIYIYIYTCEQHTLYVCIYIYICTIAWPYSDSSLTLNFTHLTHTVDRRCSGRLPLFWIPLLGDGGYA